MATSPFLLTVFSEPLPTPALAPKPAESFNSQANFSEILAKQEDSSPANHPIAKIDKGLENQVCSDSGIKKNHSNGSISSINKSHSKTEEETKINDVQTDANSAALALPQQALEIAAHGAQGLASYTIEPTRPEPAVNGAQSLGLDTETLSTESSLASLNSSLVSTAEEKDENLSSLPNNRRVDPQSKELANRGSSAISLNQSTTKPELLEEKNNSFQHSNKLGHFQTSLSKNNEQVSASKQRLSKLEITRANYKMSASQLAHKSISNHSEDSNHTGVQTKALAQNDFSLSNENVSLATSALPASTFTTASTGFSFPQVVNKDSLVLQVPTSVFHSTWGSAIGKQLLFLSENKLSKMHTAELRLDPAHLGPLHVSINFDQNTAQASFTSAHSAVREALQAGLPQLQQALAQAGILLNHSVINEGGFSQSLEQELGNFKENNESARRHSQQSKDSSNAPVVSPALSFSIETKEGIDTFA